MGDCVENGQPRNSVISSRGQEKRMLRSLSSAEEQRAHYKT